MQARLLSLNAEVEYMLFWDSQPDYHRLIDRVNDVKTGSLVGVDKYGNKYFEDNKHYFFGEFPQMCTSRIFALKILLFSGGVCKGC